MLVSVTIIFSIFYKKLVKTTTMKYAMHRLSKYVVGMQTIHAAVALQQML